MLKKVSIQTAGSDEPVREGFVVTPETTTRELLSRARLNGYVMCPSADELPLGENETIYDKVDDGSVMFAYRQATAGAIAPASPSSCLIMRRGWRRDGKLWWGHYRTRFGSFEG